MSYDCHNHTWLLSFISTTKLKKKYKFSIERFPINPFFNFQFWCCSVCSFDLDLIFTLHFDFLDLGVSLYNRDPICWRHKGSPHRAAITLPQSHNPFTQPPFWLRSGPDTLKTQGLATLSSDHATTEPEPFHTAAILAQSPPRQVHWMMKRL